MFDFFHTRRRVAALERRIMDISELMVKLSEHQQAAANMMIAFAESSGDAQKNNVEWLAALSTITQMHGEQITLISQWIAERDNAEDARKRAMN